jgi:hypothetical protein
MPESVDDLLEEHEDDTDLIKRLRKHIKTISTENRDLKHSNLIHEAGISKLSPRQIKAVLKSFDDGEKIDKDTVRAAADELGFLKTEPPPDPNKPQGNEGNGAEAHNGQQTPPNDPSNPPTDPPPDPVNESLTGLSQQELATVMSMRGGGARTTVEDFQRRLNEAKTAEAAQAIISQFGPSVGIMLDTDVP